jgi:hypothetical protein
MNETKRKQVFWIKKKGKNAAENLCTERKQKIINLFLKNAYDNYFCGTRSQREKKNTNLSKVVFYKPGSP